MSAEPRFEPILPDHAVERCAISVAFSPALPSKLYRKTQETDEDLRAQLQLKPIDAPSINFRIVDGKIASVDPKDAPRQLAAADGTLSAILSDEEIVLVSSRYTRWSPFLQKFMDFFAISGTKYTDAVSIKSLKVEYVDRFYWTGKWENFEISQLIRNDCSYTTTKAQRAERQWHTHSGWFEFSEERRRLVNVNIDVATGKPDPSSPSFPTVGILTSLQDQYPGARASFAPSESAQLQGRLQELHECLKALIGEIVTDEIAARIHLTAAASA